MNETDFLIVRCHMHTNTMMQKGYRHMNTAHNQTLGGWFVIAPTTGRLIFSRDTYHVI